MATAIKLQEIHKVSGRGVFFDANVILYIFWPTGNISWEARYSKAFKELLTQKNPLFIDFQVVSEVVNRVFRIEFAKYSQTQPNSQPPVQLKQFRGSSEGQQVLQDLFLILKSDVIPLFEVLGQGFDKQSIESFLVVDTLDFTDKAILHRCHEHDLVLFTNDLDFSSTQLTVLTGNPKY